MVICPQCGYPYEDNQLVIGERNVSCAHCAWSGSSTQLILAPDEAPVREMQQFYEFLARDIAPTLAKKMLDLGLFKRSADQENIAKIARVLKNGTRGTFQGILASLFAEEVSDDGSN